MISKERLRDIRLMSIAEPFPGDYRDLWYALKDLQAELDSISYKFEALTIKDTKNA